MPGLPRRFLWVLLACGSPSATVALTTGGETDTFTAPPPVTSFLVQEVDHQGNHATLADGGWPSSAAGNVDLGNPSQEDIASIQFLGFAADGGVVVTGATPYGELGALSGATVGLFVQRRGTCGRLPNGFLDGRAAPLLAVSSQGVYVAGGASVDAGPNVLGTFDMYALAATSTWLAETFQPSSFALVQLATQSSDGDLALAFLVGPGGAAELGLNTGYMYAVEAGATFAWSDLAGGATVMGNDGTAYIVGASRSASPSSALLVLPPSGEGGASSTLAERQGAAVGLTPTGSVFVYGGNLAADAGPGAEIIAGGSLVSNPVMSCAPDPTQGLATVSFGDGTSMLLVGSPGGNAAWSNAPATQVTLQECAMKPFGVASDAGGVAGPLVAASVFATGNGTFLLVGDDTGGNTRVFRLDATSTTELPLRIPRQAARAIQFSTGNVLVVGGGTSTIESCVP